MRSQFEDYNSTVEVGVMLRRNIDAKSWGLRFWDGKEKKPIIFTYEMLESYLSDVFP
jgi:hypothetical protein